MKLTDSVSFWALVFIAIFSFVIGCLTHWVLGVLIFCLAAGSKWLLFSVILDTFTGGLKYHHDREDERARKIIISNMLVKAAQSGVRPPIDMRLNKL